MATIPQGDGGSSAVAPMRLQPPAFTGRGLSYSTR